jgi:hypothetical protein
MRIFRLPNLLIAPAGCCVVLALFVVAGCSSKNPPGKAESNSTEEGRAVGNTTPPEHGRQTDETSGRNEQGSVGSHERSRPAGPEKVGGPTPGTDKPARSTPPKQ